MKIIELVLIPCMKKILWLIWLSIGLFSLAKAQDNGQGQKDSTIFALPKYAHPIQSDRADTSGVRPTTGFDPALLKDFKAGQDYQYDRETQAGLSLWERFIRWLASLLPQRETEDDRQTSQIWTWLIRLVAAIILVYAVTKMLGIDIPFNLDFRGKKAISAAALTEDIHTIDFPKLIGEAIGEQDYRMAVRLHYLLALKQMTDKGLIDWRNWKTNDDYVQEIKDQDLRFSFNQMTLVFDFTWYGEFEMNAQNFVSAQNMFERFTAQTNQTPIHAKA